MNDFKTAKLDFEPVLEKNTKIGNQKIQPLGLNPPTLGIKSNAGVDDDRTIQPVSSTTNDGGGLANPEFGAESTAPAPENPPSWQDGYEDQNQQAQSEVSALQRNLQIPNETVGLASPQNQEIKNGELVSEQMNNLLSENSKYLQLARTGAMQQAASRGLTNSSIAAGAGENAAIQNALPIAQQDANTNFQTNTANTSANNRFAENKQIQNFNMERDAANAGYNQDNMILQADIVSREQNQAFLNQLSTMDRSAFINTQRDVLLQSFQTLNLDQEQQNRLEQTAVEFAYQQEQARFNMASNFQNQYLDASNSLQTNWSMEIQAIYQNGEMTADQQRNAVNIATTRYQQQVAYLAAMYSEMGAWNVVVEQFPQSDEQIGNNSGENPAGGGDTGGDTGRGGSDDGESPPYDERIISPPSFGGYGR